MVLATRCSIALLFVANYVESLGSFRSFCHRKLLKAEEKTLHQFLHMMTVTRDKIFQESLYPDPRNLGKAYLLVLLAPQPAMTLAK